MTRIDCTNVATMLAEHALGCLPSADAAHVDSHVASCGDCAHQLDGLLVAVASLEREHATLAPAPPADLRDLVLDAVEAATRPPTRRRGWLGSLPQLPRRSLALGAAPSLALAAACVVLALQLADSRQLVRQLKDDVHTIESRPTLAVLKGASVKNFREDGPFDQATAQVVLGEDTGMVTVRRVPDPPTGMVWQVWQVDDEDTIRNIGTIEQGSEAVFLALEDIDREELKRIMITAEPVTGDESDPPGDDVVAESTIA